MDVNKIKIITLFTLSCFMLMDCRNTTTELDEDISSIIYSNSFEKDTDTIGWKGFGARMFRNDTPPDGGQRSIFISGGCVAPHAYFDVKVKNAGDYTIQCWGRVLENGGIISIRQVGDTSMKNIMLSIIDTTWTFYMSSHSLFCPANESIRLSLSSGGIVPGSMLVDLLEIRRAN
jgi:hypothetical protein